MFNKGLTQGRKPKAVDDGECLSHLSKLLLQAFVSHRALALRGLPPKLRHEVRRQTFH